MSDITNSIKKRDRVVTHLFDTSLGLVWKVWADPKHVMQWGSGLAPRFS